MHMEKQSERLRRSHRIYADGIMLCGCAWGDCLYVQGVWRYLEYDKLSVSTLFLYYLLFGGDAKTNTFKNMKKVLYVAMAVIALSMASCSTGNYLTTSSNLNLNQTQVVLSEANFKVVKQVSTSIVYQSKLKFDAAQLKQSAYAALLKEAKLTGSQTIINVTMEQIVRKKAAFLGLGIPKFENAILVSGTVIEFTK